MKNYFNKLMGLALITASSLVLLTACGKSTDEPASNNATQPTSTPVVSDQGNEPTDAVVPEEPARDLGGKEIIIGNWWEAEEPAPPKTQLEEDTLAYREEIMEKYNFTVKQKKLGGWGEYPEVMITSTMAGQPAADVFTMGFSFMAAPLAQGLLYPLNTISTLDFTEAKWNQEMIENMTFGENIFGMKAGRVAPTLGVFFNKRLLQEAGIDPEEPYNLQAANNWTWETFADLLKKTTRDTNNDGTPDVYGLASFSVDYFTAAVFSNNGQFIAKDENGKFYNSTNEANVLEALQWARSMYDLGYHAPQPEGSNWDWFLPAFKEGKVAFQAAEQYKVGQWEDMSDDWGFVLFPAGPNGSITSAYTDNVFVIPAGFDAQHVEDIGFVYDLYSNDTPGHEDTDWRTNYYPNFRDTRAVDETLVKFYEPGVGKINLMALVDGVEIGDIAYGLDGNTATPAEQIEKVQGLWQTFIDAANGEQ